MIPLLIFAITMGLSLWASHRVKSVYRRYAQEPSISGITGAEAARRVMADAGIQDVDIVSQEGELVDHYDPIHKRLVLSTDNYRGHSISALAVSAHEAGHAIQHARAYAPLNMRMAAVGATQFASQIVMWLPLIGLFTGFIRPHTVLFIMATGWGVIMLLISSPCPWSSMPQIALGRHSATLASSRPARKKSGSDGYSMPPRSLMSLHS